MLDHPVLDEQQQMDGMMMRMVDPLEPESERASEQGGSFLSGMLLQRLDALAVISPLPHCPGTVVLLLTQGFICGHGWFLKSAAVASRLLQIVLC